MKKKTYKKMTTPTLKMRFSSLKMTIEVMVTKYYVKILNQLAKRHFITHHFVHYNRVVPIEGVFHSTPKVLPIFKTSRGEFQLSYITEMKEFVYENWYETKKGKIICRIADDKTFHTTVKIRSQVESFEIHLSHDECRWLQRPKDMIYTTLKTFKREPIKAFESCMEVRRLNYKTIAVDFSKAVFMLTRTFIENVDEMTKIGDKIKAVELVMQSNLTNRTEEINELLTGVKYDGEYVTPVTHKRLAPNLICRKCGIPVFYNETKERGYRCLKHNDDIYEHEVLKVDPIRYGHIMRNTSYLLEKLCKESVEDEQGQTSKEDK